jgi:hopanoid-associated phosphorylase
MVSSRPALLVITGLQREAQIASGDGLFTLCSGGNPELLRERLAELSPVRGILSFGLAGGLASHLQSGDLVIASHIVAGGTRHEADPDWHEAIASALGAAMPVHRGTIAGHDAVLTKTADKAQLHALTAALAVDMESHIAADYAQRYGIPFAAIRSISDPAGRSLPDIAHNALRPDGSVDLTKVISGVVRRPSQIPALIAAGIDSNKAFASLRRCRGLLGPFFGLGPTHI